MHHREQMLKKKKNSFTGTKHTRVYTLMHTFFEREHTCRQTLWKSLLCSCIYSLLECKLHCHTDWALSKENSMKQFDAFELFLFCFGLFICFVFEKDNYLTEKNRSLHITYCSAQISHYFIPIGRDGKLCSESLELARATASLLPWNSRWFESSEPKVHETKLFSPARPGQWTPGWISIASVVLFPFPLSLICLDVLESIFKGKI